MPGPAVRPLHAPQSFPPVHRVAGPLLGRVIGDRYRLIALVAEGLASSVYKAEHVRMGKALCVKILRGPLARDPELAARFRSEGRVVSRLSHPHTIAVFDFGELEANEGLYLVMEYLHGENLASVLRREGRIPEARAAAIGDQLLGALGEAHEAGIVHRDVKPANVMLLRPRNDADFAKLVDFGIAEIEGQGPGGGLGTPTYLSPEQASGGAPDARSDLYSLGATLYEMVGGRPPFVADNPMAVLAAHLHETPAPLQDLCPEVSPAFAAVVHRALAKRPGDRFGSSDEMRAALQATTEARVASPAATGGDDAGTFAVEPRKPGDAPDAILLVPSSGLALGVSAWAPRAEDLDGGATPRDRFETLAAGEQGQPILARLPGLPSAGAPVLVRVKAAHGQGPYRVLAIGPGAASGRAVLSVLRALEAEGRFDDALLVAAAFVHVESASPSRAEVLRLAGRLVEGSAGKEKGAGPGRPTP